MRKRHKEYLQEQLEFSNPITKWKIMKNLINKTNCYKIPHLNYLLMVLFAMTLKCIANAYNDFFVEVGPTLANNISSTVNPMSYVTNHVINSMYVPVITECEIMTVVSSLTNSSPGWDNLHARLLKPYILEYIIIIYYYNDSKCDDSDMLRQMSLLYAKSNKLLRTFSHCSSDVKVTLFQSYCTALYCPFFCGTIT